MLNASVLQLSGDAGRASHSGVAKAADRKHQKRVAAVAFVSVLIGITAALPALQRAALAIRLSCGRAEFVGKLGLTIAFG